MVLKLGACCVCVTSGTFGLSASTRYDGLMQAARCTCREWIEHGLETSYVPHSRITDAISLAPAN